MDSFKTIKTFTHSTEITVLRSRLEAEGIQCFLKDEYTVDANPFYSNAIGGVKLQVKEKDVTKAIEILKEGGYLDDSKPYQPKLLILFDKYTKKLPLVGGLGIEVRLMIIISLIALIFSLTLYFISLPTTEEKLTEQSWCVDNVTYNGKNYTPKTDKFIHISGGGYCEEEIDFRKNGSIKFPGFKSQSTNGRWSLQNDSLNISQINKFGYIYNGRYQIKISNNILLLKSNTTSLTCNMVKRSSISLNI